MKRKLITAAAAGLLLCACGKKADSSSQDESMHYIKTSVMYDTITDMYDNPDSYVGKNYHFVGTLYPGNDSDTGESFYSIATTDSHGDEYIGIELDWDDYSGLEDFDRVTVEGKLERSKIQKDSTEYEILILRVSSLEKRES